MRSKLIATVLALSASLQAPAATLPSDDPATAACIQTAVASFQIPELPLWIILDVERGTLGKVSGNTNGSYDIGPMQINSTWLPRLAKLGVTEDRLLNDLCTNIYVGAWVFTHEYRRFNGDVGKAIAHYHSPTPRRQQRYLGLIQGAIQRRLRAMERVASAPAPTPTRAATVAGAVPPPDAGFTQPQVVPLARAVFW